MPLPQRSSIRDGFNPDPVVAERGFPTTTRVGAPASQWPLTGGLAVDSGPRSTGFQAIVAVLRGARRRDTAYVATKRALDIVIAATLLILLLPVFALVALAIWRKTGRPILYRGERVGRFGRSFTIVKFRSMRADASPTAHLLFVRGLMRDPTTTCPLYKVADDPRITPLGAFLRRTSLDELPQLWNVLRGEMSMVGPRPDVPYALDDYADAMHRRLDVKPGITGLWQVSGRSRLSVREMYRLDLAYVAQASLSVDVRILLRTIPVVLSREGAA